MFIPGHLIIEERRRRIEEQQTDRRIPLYAPQPHQIEDREREPRNDNTESSERRGAIIIDLNDYSEVED